MNKLKLILVLNFLLTTVLAYPQDTKDDYLKNYFGIDIGMQISGIKKEDFILENISPQIGITAGRWVSPIIALSGSYQGFYFKYIGDDVKHYYAYYSGNVVFNVVKISGKPRKDLLELKLSIGSGYFYNYYYRRPNICLNASLAVGYTINEVYDFYLKSTSIMGWDIYQGNEDILPSIGIGLLRNF